MTLDNLKIKFFNIIRFFIYLILDLIISINKHSIIPNTLLIIKLDSIGDYLLFRNFLEFIRKSERFRNYKITLLGNIVCKELAETFDSETIDKFIWLDRQRFNNNILYKFEILKFVYSCGYEIVIDCAYSREILYGDSLVKTSRAQIRIGSVGSPDEYVKWKRNLLTNKFYTKLISTSNQIMFEFERNKEFFSKVLNVNLDICKPMLNTEKIDSFDFKEKYIVVFPGANNSKRIWSAEKYSNVIDYLLQHYNFNIVLAGSSKDYIITEEIFNNFNSNRVLNFVGKTNLPKLAKLISNSKLLISNETSAIHFAASVNTPFVCISNGNHFGRFHPYPKEMEVKGVFIYPKEIINFISNQEYLKMKYGYGSDLDINSIREDEVISEIENLLR